MSVMGGRTPGMGFAPCRRISAKGVYVRVYALRGLLTGCYMCLSVDVTKLRNMLLLNEARHFHGNTALCSQPDAKPLNYIFLAESTSIASGLQSSGTMGAPDASPSSPTFQQSSRGDQQET